MKKKIGIRIQLNKLQTDLHYLQYLSLVSLVKCATSLIFTSSYDGRGQTFPPYQPSLAKISNSGTAIKCCYMLLIDFSYSTAKKWIIEQQSDFKQQGWHLWGNPLTKKFLADPSRLQTYSITLSPAIRMQCHSLQLLPVKQLASHPEFHIISDKKFWHKWFMNGHIKNLWWWAVVFPLFSISLFNFTKTKADLLQQPWLAELKCLSYCISTQSVQQYA